MKHEPGMAYDTKKLNKVFAVLSVIFLIATLTVFFDDFIRPWKVVQIKGKEVERKVIDAQIQEAMKNIDGEKVKELEKRIAAITSDLETGNNDLVEARKDLKNIEGDIYAEKLVNGKINADLSEYVYRWETANAHNDPETPQLKEELDTLNSAFAESRDRLKALEKREKEIRARIAKITEGKTKLEKEKKDIIGKVELLKLAKKKTDIDPVAIIRNSPFIDYLDPTIKIEQVVLKDVATDLYFQQVEQVDRCMTCHMFIDRPGFENEEQPYATHPNLELMVGTKSHHPMKRFGCTTCHGGEGHRVNDFNSPAHTPNSEEQKAEWIEKYGWHEPHHVPKPMLKLSQVESQCIKCHKGVEHIPEATVVNRGRQKIRTFGCYGCHKIEGYEHLRKPGPQLTKLKGKLTKEFSKNWIWSPQAFNKHAKMPSFFGQVNNSTEEFMKKNVAEVNAMVEFIYDKSESYKPQWSYRGGNKEQGKKLIQTIGCLGCHQVEGVDEDYQLSKSRAGSYLTGLGSKLDPDWLVTWLIKPSHYSESTIMPSFRLTQKQANDIAAFLLSSKNKKFEELKFERTNTAMRDEILIDYFSAFDTLESANKKLASMSNREKTLELGYRSIGKYGCYSCHDIDGFEGRGPIGPELTKVGSKPLTQVGFGHSTIEKKLDVWFYHHLQNPRQWDIGTNKKFGDLTRMPNFHLNDKDINDMQVALLGFVDEYIPKTGIYHLSGHEALAAEGSKIITKYNCMGCHAIDGVGGEILKNYPDDVSAGPPMLVGHGERVQADWLHDFLKNVFSIRPYLDVRMPSFNFSEEERNQLVSYFMHKSKEEIFEVIPKKVVWEPGERAAARKLFHESLACTSCHTGGFSKEEALAPNLHYAKRKLRTDWMAKWLENPQAILSETTMPNFWEDGIALDEETLGGDKDKQIQALIKYIHEFGDNELQPPQAYLK